MTYRTSDTLMGNRDRLHIVRPINHCASIIASILIFARIFRQYVLVSMGQPRLCVSAATL
jgi:hypothetical protein